MTYRRLLLTAAATSLALAACDQKAAAPVTGAPIASLPLAQAVPPPETIAPDLNALPAAPPIQRAAKPRRPVYAYVDDAYRLGDAFADSPPDYTVDYEGSSPYVWRSGAGEYRVVEQTPDGERDYYYRGDSDYPFLVRDNRYSYAYDGPELVEVYDSYGRPYPNYAAAEMAIAARYLFRARRLYYAAVHEQRRAAYAGDWRVRRDAVLAPQRQWAAERDRNADWRRVHDERVQALPPQQRDQWRQEREQRQAYVTRIAPVIAQAPPPHRREERGPPPLPSKVPAPVVMQGGPPQVLPQPAPRRPGEPGQHAQIERLRQEQQAQAQAQAQAPAQGREQQRAQAEAARRSREVQVQQAQQAQQSQAAAQTQQRAQAEAANRARGDAERQRHNQLDAQAQAAANAQRGQQRTQADTAKRVQTQADAQAREQAHARDEAQRQQQAQAHDQQQRAQQAEAANHAREDAARQQQQQAREQQHPQADAANHAREEAAQHAQIDKLRQQQQAQAMAQAQAQAAAQHQQQAQAAEQGRRQQAEAQAAAQHQQQQQAAQAAQRQQQQAAQAAQAEARKAAAAGAAARQDRDKKNEHEK